MKFGLAAIIPVLFFTALPRTADAGLLRLTSVRSNVLKSPSDSELAPPANLAQLETTREGGHQPQIEGDIQKWDETTKLDVRTSVAIASLWVIMLMSMPAWIRFLSGEPFTKTQWLIAGVMWCAVFGGMYAFTHIVKFQSGHFREVRVLTLVECIYVMSQVITTVGYGDITPAYPRGQVFVGVYVLCSLFVIAMIVSDMVALIMNSLQKFQERLLKKEHVDVNYNLKGKAKANAEHDRKGHKALSAKVERPAFSPVIYSFSMYSLFAVTWILFFHYYPGEGKTWLQAIYMSVITLSTVGFGAFTPNTTWGMVFASFWMIFGSAALVSVVTSFTDYTLKMQEYERFDPDQSKKHLAEFKEKHQNSEEMTETQFIRFMLAQRGIATENDVNDILANFHILADGDAVTGKTVNLDQFTPKDVEDA